MSIGSVMQQKEHWVTQPGRSFGKSVHFLESPSLNSEKKMVTTLLLTSQILNCLEVIKYVKNAL